MLFEKCMRPKRKMQKRFTGAKQDTVLPFYVLMFAVIFIHFTGVRSATPQAVTPACVGLGPEDGTCSWLY